MPFIKPYLFDSTQIVVIQHPVNNKTLRVKPKQLQQINHNGGKGQFARWEAIPQDSGSKVRLNPPKQINLRIMKINEMENMLSMLVEPVANSLYLPYIVSMKIIQITEAKLESNVFLESI